MDAEAVVSPMRWRTLDGRPGKEISESLSALRFAGNEGSVLGLDDEGMRICVLILCCVCVMVRMRVTDSGNSG